MILYNHDAALMAWASERLGIDLTGPRRYAVGVVRDGELLAAVVWSDFVWPDIHVSMVATSPRWATREHFREILAYPFQQLRCKRVTAVTEERNLRARRFLEWLGFKQEGRHPDASPNGDVISYGLLAVDAERWLLRKNYGQKFRIVQQYA